MRPTLAPLSVGRALLWYHMHLFVERIMGNVPWRLIGRVFPAHSGAHGSDPTWRRAAAGPFSFAYVSLKLLFRVYFFV